jgi:hypothetical protein
VTTTRSVLRGAAALVLAALLVGPSAHAGAPAQPAPAAGHVDNEWLMMGRDCGAGLS